MRLLQIARAAAFNAVFYGWTILLSLAVLPIAPFLRAPEMRAVARFWERGIQLALRLIVGLGYEVRGRAHLPDTPAIIASKHQSAWETLVYHALIPDVVIGLKHALTLIPVFGWYLMKGGNIRIDRGGAARALRSLVEGARDRAGKGCHILIFPEGTRRPPGASPDYKPGIAALYAGTGLPVVPVALNSGVFWGRRSFLKRPGIITLEFLPPIPPGLERKRFMAELEARIEPATARLVEEARTRFALATPTPEAGQAKGHLL